MILEDPNKHLTDQEFFAFIKFFDLVIQQKGLNEEDAFDLSTFGLGSQEGGTVFNLIFPIASALDISVSIKKGYKFEEGVEKTKETIANKPPKEQKKLAKILEEIDALKETKMEDIGLISWPWYEIYSHIQFTPLQYKLSKKKVESLNLEIEEYLDSLINNKLTINKNNYFNFETLKKVFIKLIIDNKKIELYGKNFIIQERIDWNGEVVKMPDFCIVQTAYALQKLGYLEILNIWTKKEYSRDGSSRISLEKDPEDYICINIIIHEDFKEEIDSEYRKENPKKMLEGFDEKRGVLKFAGKEIEVAKKGKETDAVLLLKSLIKEKSTAWKHNDEILKDWGYNYDEQKDLAKNKVYFAAQKANNAIALKTQVDDFVESNTSKARINPKYRKIDE